MCIRATHTPNAYGLLWFIVIALDSLIGGLIFILRKSPAPAALAAEAKD
jgi:hypothetical protein